MKKLQLLIAKIRTSKIHTLRVHDSSVAPKTSDKLLALLESVIGEAEKDWGVRVVAVCTDASGESRKARKLLKIKLPHLVTPDCYAHQVGFFTQIILSAAAVSDGCPD